MNGPAGNNERPQEGNSGFVYAIHAVGTNRVKLGFSQEPEKRMAALQIGSPFPLQLIYKMPGGPRDERRLHSRFRSCRIFGEWFEFTSGQIQQIKTGKLLALAPFNFKTLLPELNRGWWDITQGKHNQSLKLRWREKGKRRVFVFPSLRSCMIDRLSNSDTGHARWLLFDYLAGHLEDAKMKAGSIAEMAGELIERYNRQMKIAA